MSSRPASAAPRNPNPLRKSQNKVTGPRPLSAGNEKGSSKAKKSSPSPITVSKSNGSPMKTKTPLKKSSSFEVNITVPTARPAPEDYDNGDASGDEKAVDLANGNNTCQGDESCADDATYKIEVAEEADNVCHQLRHMVAENSSPRAEVPQPNQSEVLVSLNASPHLDRSEMSSSDSEEGTFNSDRGNEEEETKENATNEALDSGTKTAGTSCSIAESQEAMSSCAISVATPFTPDSLIKPSMDDDNGKGYNDILDVLERLEDEKLVSKTVAVEGSPIKKQAPIGDKVRLGLLFSSRAF